MPSPQKKEVTNPLSEGNFPVVFEKGEPKAVIIGIQKYREFELLVDNLINLREEDEDAILTDSGILEKLIAKAMEESRAAGAPLKWEDEIDAL